MLNTICRTTEANRVMTTATPRTRRRVNLTAATPTPEELEKQLIDLLVDAYKSGRVESEAKSRKDRLIKTLEAQMTTNGRKTITGFVDGIRIEGVISNGKVTTYVDSVKLAGLVDAKEALPLANFSQDAVKNKFGTNILNASLSERPGEYKLRIGKAK